METDMDVYKEDFLQEVNEYLEIFNQAFVDLENGDNDALDEIFRVAHTIKGMAGFLGYALLEKLCHSMEEVLSGIKCGDISIDGDLIDTMLSTVDRIYEMVENIESDGSDDVKIDDLLSAFETYKDQRQDECEYSAPDELDSSSIQTVECEVPERENWEEDSASITESFEKEESNSMNDDCEHDLVINVKISPASDIKELKAILVMESLKEAGRVLRTEPAEEEIDSTFKGSLKVFIRGDSAKAEEVMNQISEIDSFEIISCEQEDNNRIADPSFSEDTSSSNTGSFESDESNYKSEDCENNLVINVKISPASDIKELKAILVMESLKEAGQVLRTEPAEEEIDSTFKGLLKVFLRGDAGTAEEVMNQISEIDSFEIISCKQAENKGITDPSFSEDAASSDTGSFENEESNSMNDDYENNLVINVKISPASDIKELKAILVMESLKEAGQVLRTEPEEEEIDSTFKGFLKVFLRGDAGKAEEVMNLISEIDDFEIIRCEQEENTNYAESQNSKESSAFVSPVSGIDDSDSVTKSMVQAGEHNLIIDVKISPASDIKELKAILVMESLKEAGQVLRTEPAEEEIDSTFKGSLKVFMNGDAGTADEVMNQISEIEDFEIISCEQEDDLGEIQSKSQDEINNIPHENTLFINGESIEGQETIDSILQTNGSLLYIFREIMKNDEYSLQKKFRIFMYALVGNICSSIPADEGMQEKESHLMFDEQISKESSSLFSEEFAADSVSTSVPEEFAVDSVSSSVVEEFAADSVSSLVPEEFAADSVSSLVPEEFAADSVSSSVAEEFGADSVSSLVAEEFGADSVSSSVAEEFGADSVSSSVAEEFGADSVSSLVAEEFGADSVSSSVAEELKGGDVTNIGEKSSNQDNCANVQDTTKKGSGANKRQDTIRVRVSNIDSIMNLVGELVINKGCLLQLSQEHRIPELEEATAILDKSITSLQDEVMRMRMVKIEKVFNKFPRMVRDLSRKFGKDINFELEGQETELDRTILDEINDPLVHLVRNCVDHGIETPEERKMAGKSQTGHIKLSAKRERSNVIIEIEDDGQGLDLEKIKNKALDNGIISSADLDKLSDDDISMLIFTSGLSTKDSATEISGRGVGMDAVKTSVEKLGGKIKVYSEKGKGTRMKINLPPTVAIIKSLVVESGNETYAIPIANVVEALDVNKDNFKIIRDQPLLYVREKLFPAIRLKEFFDIAECGDKLEKEVGIIVEKENEEIALLVDSIIDQQEIVIKPLGSVLSKVKGFIGVTILGDGRVIPILDVSALVGGDIDA